MLSRLLLNLVFSAARIASISRAIVSSGCSTIQRASFLLEEWFGLLLVSAHFQAVVLNNFCLFSCMGV